MEQVKLTKKQIKEIDKEVLEYAQTDKFIEVTLSIKCSLFEIHSAIKEASENYKFVDADKVQLEFYSNNDDELEISFYAKPSKENIEDHEKILTKRAYEKHYFIQSYERSIKEFEEEIEKIEKEIK